MRIPSLSHLADHVLLQALRALVVRDRANTVELLVHLAEVDERRLFLPAGQPSMYHYCIHVLHLSESAAFKRIRSARAARKHPELYEALADGRLHLSAVTLIAKYLTPSNARSLIEAASHRSKAELELLKATLEPRRDVATTLTPVATAADPVIAQPLSPGPVGNIGVSANSRNAETNALHVPDIEAPLHQSPHPTPAPHHRLVLAPLAPTRYELRCTLSQEAHDQLRHAQELLGHAVPNGDLAQVIERAIGALVSQLEKKHGGGASRTKSRRGAPKGRHIPAAMRAEVWRRDEGRCTFVGSSGERCPSRSPLEYDHVKPVARGGETTVANLRLRCRAHNQYEADRVFGAGFMMAKRGGGGSAAARARATTIAATPGST